MRVRDAALAMGFREPIGYGLVAATLLCRAITDVVGPGAVRQITTRFVDIVSVGETLVTRVVVESTYDRDGRTFAQLQCGVCTTAGRDLVVGSATVETTTAVGLMPGWETGARHGRKLDGTNRDVELPDGASVVVVERSAVCNFARSVDIERQEYFDADVARARHLRDIPAPPTFGFGATLEYWGRWPELQPGRVSADALLDLTEALERIAGPGRILHAEQAFDYHRPIYVGDMLVGTNRIGDPQVKQGSRARLVFLSCESRWCDYRTDEVVMTSRMTAVAPREGQS